MAEAQMPHKLTLEDRRKLTMTGVLDVISFEEDGAVLNTGLGMLTVHGRSLQLKTLAPEGGQVMVEGEITALVYGQSKSNGGWLGRLFG